MEHQPNSKINQFVKNHSGAETLEGIETSKIWGHLTSTWGMGERVIPKIMGDDSASQRIVETLRNSGALRKRKTGFRHCLR
jgi:hypothetical protein